MLGSKVSWFFLVHLPQDSASAVPKLPPVSPVALLGVESPSFVTWKYSWFRTSSKLRDLKRPNPSLPQLLGFFVGQFLETVDADGSLIIWLETDMNIKTSKLKWLPGMNNDHDNKKSRQETMITRTYKSYDTYYQKPLFSPGVFHVFFFESQRSQRPPLLRRAEVKKDKAPVSTTSATGSSVEAKAWKFSTETMALEMAFNMLLLMWSFGCWTKTRGGPPKSSILRGFSIIFTIHFGGTPSFRNIHLLYSFILKCLRNTD